MEARQMTFSLAYSTRLLIRVFLLQIFVLNLAIAASSRAQNVKEVAIQINEPSISLDNVLKIIERKTEFSFSYNERDVNLSQNVSVTPQESSVYEVLLSISRQSRVNFKQIDNTIFIQKPPRKSSPKVEVPESFSVSGTVYDQATRDPLPGVSVILKESGTGTTTDLDGNFSLSVPSNNSMMIFSFIGYLKQEIAVGEERTFRVSLTEDIQQLSEVVVVGYGSTLRKNFAGSSVKLSSKEISEIPVASPDQVLQGLASGVQVVNNSGTPGGGVRVLIRGQTSINASNDPLYIVDGIPILNEPLGVSYLGGEVQSPLVGINPNDIESITVLKDASSTAIYGARGANGVVLINTKRGSSDGKLSVNFNMLQGWSDLVKRPEMLNREQYIEVINEGRANSGLPLILEQPDSNQPNALVFGPGNEDWLSNVLRVARLQEYQLNLSGSSEKTRYYLSASYRDQEGVVVSTRLRRGTIRLNLDHQPSQWFKMASSLGFSRDLNQRVYENNTSLGPYTNALTAPPTEPAYLPDGSYNFFTFAGARGSNPIADGVEGQHDNFTNKFIANTNFSLFPVEGVEIKTNVSLDYTNLREDFFEPSFTSAAIVLGGSDGTGLDGAANRSRRTDFESLTYAIEPTINYNNTIDDIHNVNFVGGLTLQERSTRVNTFVGGGIPGNDQLSYYTALDGGFGSSSLVDYAFNSLFGRLIYSFDEKYIINGTVRRDGSSRFGSDNQYGLFWATSLAWNFSSEPFFQNIDWLSFGKLRGGYGVTGNDQIGDFQYIGGFSAVGDYSGSALGPSAIADPGLKWEETSSFDIGLELGFLDDRFTFSAGYFNSNTEDLLFRRAITGKSGFNQITGNIGNINNEGVEFELAAALLNTNKLTWNVKLNVSSIRNEVTKLDQPIENPETATILDEGLPIGAFKTLRFTGVNAVTGNAIYEDANGDGQIDARDEIFVGSAQPDYFGGVSSDLSYGPFKLDVLVNFSQGQQIYNVGQFLYEGRFSQTANFPTYILDRWQSEGDISSNPKLFATGSNNTRVSSRYISDGSFVRLRNVTLSYQLPPAILPKLRLSRLRIFVTGTNLITLTPYRGLDPEVSAFNQNTFGPGGEVTRNSNILIGNDFLTVPQSKQFIIGLNIGL